MNLFAKTTLILLTLSLTSSLSAAVHADEPYDFIVTQADHRFDTTFEIDSRNTYPSQVKKSRRPWSPWLTFRLSDEHGGSASGAYQWFNTSWIFGASMMEMVITNTEGNNIAFIDGQAATTEKAKFSIYAYDENNPDAKSQLTAIAYLDQACESFTLYYPEDKTRRIATLRRITVLDARDYWTVSVFKPERIDDRVIRIFAAWAVDSQSEFRLDDVDLPPLDLDDLLDD